MFKKLAFILGGFALLAVAVYGIRSWVLSSRQEAEARALTRTAHWAQGPSLAARLMVDEYGPPQWVSDSRLEWFSVPPWKRIVVSDSAAGFLEHAVSYRIPPDKLPELLRFKRGLVVDPQSGELAARGESEEDNLLCLNLANDIALGKRSAVEADEFYSATIQKTGAGKSSVYMERLLFAVTLPAEAEMPLP
jgi:hypothetical protein